MTAQTIEPGVSRMWTPDPVRQRPADDTIEYLPAPPDDAPPDDAPSDNAPPDDAPSDNAPPDNASPAADSAKKLVRNRPFEIRPPIGDINP
jgi:hypothetical protein